VSEDPAKPTVVLGLGNVLMKDDGVGVHAVWALMADPPPGCVPIEIGTVSLAALDYLEGAVSVVALDAVEAGHPPGTVVRFELDERARGEASSLHDLGLPGVLSMLPEASRPRVIVLGVEPAEVDIGLDLSPVVAGALPRLLAAVRRELKGCISS
jgi:hydrogenase maturation protease